MRNFRKKSVLLWLALSMAVLISGCASPNNGSVDESKGTGAEQTTESATEKITEQVTEKLTESVTHEPKEAISGRFFIRALSLKRQ